MFNQNTARAREVEKSNLTLQGFVYTYIATLKWTKMSMFIHACGIHMVFCYITIQYNKSSMSESLLISKQHSISCFSNILNTN